jgi:hypothetical protein
VDRFWSKIEVGDCWLWTAALSAEGYGMFRFGENMQYAHRVAWMLLVGPIPRGHQIDHLCRVRNCVNPDHLEPVTPAVNSRRSYAGAINGRRKRAMTHCIWGHEFDTANTAIRPCGRRRCRACDRARHAVQA